MTDFPCRRYQNGEFSSLSDEVAPEVSLRVHLGEATARLWAFPAELGVLALGHCALDMCRQGQTPVLVRAEDNDFWFEAAPAQAQAAASEIAPANTHARLGRSARLSLRPDEIMAAMAEFIAAPGLWEATGCFHRAAVFDPAKKVFVRRAEDIGRHNCLDRLSGYALGERFDPAGLVLFVSARMTASLMAKAVRAGYPMIVSRSAVTTAGIDAAERAGATLCGFARENRFTVFADPGERIA